MNRIFSLLLIILFPMITWAQAKPPVVPDPFCSPKDFFQFLEQKNHDRVLYAVQKCANINLNDVGPKGEQFLVTVIEQKWEDIFTLVKNRKDISFQTAPSSVNPKLWKNPLHQMLIKQRYDWFLEVLGRSDIDLNQTDGDGAFPLYFAVTLEGVPVALLDRLINDPKVNVNALYSRMSSLQWAVATGNAKGWERLLASPRVDRSTLWPTACLHQDKPQTAQLFLSLIVSGSYDPNQQCLGGGSALLVSLSYRPSFEIIEALLKHPKISYAAPGQSYEVAKRALEIYRLTTYSGHELAILTAILQHPTFHWKDQDSKGSNLWHLLSRAGNNPEVIAMFSKLPADGINSPDTNGWTPLQRAVLNAPVPAANSTEANSAFLKIALHPQIKIDLQTQVNLGGVSYKPKVNASASLLALANGKLEHWKVLRQRGAQVTQAGDVNAVGGSGTTTIYALASQLFSTKAPADVLEAFKWLLSHPDLDINKKTANDEPYDSTSISLGLESLSQKSVPAAALEGLRLLLKDPRLDKNRLAASFNKPIYGACSSLMHATYHQLVDVAEVIVQNSNLEYQSLSCSPPELYQDLNPLQLAMRLKSKPLVQMYLTKTKIPAWTDRNESRGVSAYQMALADGNIDFVMMFIDAGYLEELNRVAGNGNTILMKAVELKNLTLVQKLLQIKSIDPNVARLYDETALTLAVRTGQADIFQALMQDPKTKLAASLEGLTTFEKDEELVYVRQVFAKFQIVTAEDQLAAQYAVRKLIRWQRPVSDFLTLLKKPKFDINYVLPEDSSRQIAAPNTVLTVALQKKDEVYVSEILKFKNLDLNKGTPAVAALFYLNDGWRGDCIESCLKMLLSFPNAKLSLPGWKGQSFSQIMQNSEGRFGWHYLALSDPRLIIPKEELKSFAEAFPLERDEKSRAAYLDRMFSHPAFKPLSQWTYLFFEYDSYHKVPLDVLKNWSAQLDLNTVVKDQTLLQRSIQNNDQELFDYLLSLPQVSVKGALSLAIGEHYSHPHFFDQLYAKRLKEFSQADLMAALIQYSNFRYEKWTEEDAKRIRAMAAQLKTFNGFIAAANDQGYRVVQLIENSFEDIALRIMKEDKSADLGYQHLAMKAAIDKGSLNLVAAILAKGFDVEYPVYEPRDSFKYNALTYATHLKQMKIMELLVQKGASPNSSPGWNGRNAMAVAFGDHWLVGAEWLRPRMMYLATIDGRSVFAHAVLEGWMEGVKYLLSVGYNPNESSPLAMAIYRQNDEIFKLLISNKAVDVNRGGSTDESPQRTTYPIIEAARWGRKDYVETLLKMPGIQKDIADGLGYRAIDWAATNGYNDIVELLR